MEGALTLIPQGRFADQIEALLEASSGPIITTDLRVGRTKITPKKVYVRKPTKPPKPCGYCGVMVERGTNYCSTSHAVMASKRRKAQASRA